MNEKISNLISVMKNNRFEFDEHYAATKSENCDTAYTQELQIIEKLNPLIDIYNLKAISSKHYLGNKWTKEIDCEDGDIYIFETINGEIVGKPILYIDIKVAFVSKYKNFVATITRTSYDFFANKSNHVYWCFNENGRISIVIDSVKLYNTVENTEDVWNRSFNVMQSRDKNHDFIKGKWLLENINKFEAK